MWLPGLLVAGLLFALPALAADPPIPKPPEALAKGEALYNTNCSACHGAGARGTAKGPPFLDKVYEPNHHADMAFYRAPEMGVRAHHWKFGDMPKIPGVTKDDLVQIIPYIRWLQKQAGIF
ncbi:MAG: cytochrome c [Nitrospirae bacterium]|nr:MAG: cytochrome c [Nitrospirota bacterium]